MSDERRVSRRNKLIVFLILCAGGLAVWASVERGRASIQTARWKASDAEMLDAKEMIRQQEVSQRAADKQIKALKASNEVFAAEADKFENLSQVYWRTVLNLRAGAAVATGDPVAVPPPSTHDPADPCPEPAPCLLPLGSSLRVDIAAAEGVTPAGNSAWIGAASVWRTDPPPESQLYNQPFELVGATAPPGSPGEPTPGSEVLAVPEKAERTWGRFGVLFGGSLLSPESVFIPQAEQTFSFGDDVAVNLGGVYRWKSGQLEAFASTNKSLTVNYAVFWGKK